MSIKVSVVIPVYNTGKYIEVCIDSLLAQSLPADEYEAIFVDDGSTDETPARLDRLAAEHAHMHVIHIPNSGWPGKPRNVGIDSARGEFVQFVDHDDYLGSEALERLYDYGVANGADIVIGKMAGQSRGVPRNLFRINHPITDIDHAPLIWAVSPHKMFRATFLADKKLRFPEGRRRLEDHVFVMEAYEQTRRVSVLSDYVCYFHTRRDDAGNASSQVFDPVKYFNNLREGFDIVERFTEPGSTRDQHIQRWLRMEMLDRIRGTRMLRWPDDARRPMFDEISKLAVERVSPGAVAMLGPIQGIVAALAMAGRYDDTYALAEWEAGIGGTVTLRDLRWDSGLLHIDFDAELLVGDEPMTFRRDGGAELLDPPLSQPARDIVAAAHIDTAAKTGAVSADLILRNRSTGAEYLQSVKITSEYVGPDDRLRFLMHGTAAIDPRTVMTRLPLSDGTWDLFVRVTTNGWASQSRLGSKRTEEATAARTGAVFGEFGRFVVPYWTDKFDNLSIEVALATSRLRKPFGRIRPAAADVTAPELRVTLPMHVPAPVSAIVRYTDAVAGVTTEVPGTLGADSVLRVTMPPPGTNRVRVDVAILSSTGTEPRFDQLGIELDMRGEAPSVVVRKGAPPAQTRHTPGGVVARLRRRAGRIKRLLNRP